MANGVLGGGLSDLAQMKVAARKIGSSKPEFWHSLVHPGVRIYSNFWDSTRLWMAHQAFCCLWKIICKLVHSFWNLFSLWSLVFLSVCTSQSIDPIDCAYICRPERLFRSHGYGGACIEGHFSACNTSTNHSSEFKASQDLNIPSWKALEMREDMRCGNNHNFSIYQISTLPFTISGRKDQRQPHITHWIICSSFRNLELSWNSTVKLYLLRLLQRGTHHSLRYEVIVHGISTLLRTVHILELCYSSLKMLLHSITEIKVGLANLIVWHG
jgi:hypothetical protein